MVSFFLIGAVATIAVFVLQRRRWHRALRAALIAVLLLLAAFLFLQFIWEQLPTLGPARHWYHETPYRESILFVIMLAGMAARYFTKAIEDRRERILKLRESGARFRKPKLEFDSWEFAYPLFVSAVTFGSLLSQLSEQTFTLPNAVLSFQTGFFWQTILAVRASTIQKDQPKPTP